MYEGTDVNGLPSNGTGRLGLARVMLPGDKTPRDYEAECVKTSAVALRDPFYGTAMTFDALVPANVFPYVRFPTESTDGSLVAYQVIDKRLVYVVTGVVSDSGAGTGLDEPNDFSLDGNDAHLALKRSYALLSASGPESVARVQAMGNDAVAQLVSGREVNVTAKIGDGTAEIRFTPDNLWEVLRYSDGRAAEPAVLGDKMVEELNAILAEVKAIADACAQLTVASPFGPLGPPVNQVDFLAASRQLSVIENRIERILSPNLTID